MKNRLINALGKIINTVIEEASDLLLPKEEKVKFLEKLGPDGLFANIPPAENFGRPAQVGFDTTMLKTIFGYYNPLCRQAIWEIKYRANKKLIRDFSLLLYEFILEELTDLETFANFKKPILIPIPSSKTRLREKGFNQCVLITRELIKIDSERNGNNFTANENFLFKNTDTLHQARVSNRKTRLKNLKNTFSVNMPAELNTENNSSYIIIDDVITTGATMAEAFRALHAAGIPLKKIRGFALAH